jgi:NADPH:quinone reductase-like Zn-dependent oxidoreductase
VRIEAIAVNPVDTKVRRDRPSEERLGIDRKGGNRDQSLLIIGGAGGVGSVAIQLAKLAGLAVIATAFPSRNRQMGAGSRRR